MMTVTTEFVITKIYSSKGVFVVSCYSRALSKQYVVVGRIFQFLANEKYPDGASSGDVKGHQEKGPKVQGVEWRAITASKCRGTSEFCSVVQFNCLCHPTHHHQHHQLQQLQQDFNPTCNLD